MENTENVITGILHDLERLVDSERDAITAPQLEAYAAFYTAFMSWAKYEIKWYGIRSVEEYKEMNTLILAPLSIGEPGSDVSITDDELPTYRWSLLTRLTQGLRVRTNPSDWDEMVELIIDFVIDAYPLITDNNRDIAVYTEDVANYVNTDVIEDILAVNPHIVTLALLSLLPHHALFIGQPEGIKQ